MMAVRSCYYAAVFAFAAVMCIATLPVKGMPRSHIRQMDLSIMPLESIVFAGDNVTFTCSYPKNVTFSWEFNHEVRPDSIVEGYTFLNETGQTLHWSRILLTSVKHQMTGKISCFVKNTSISIPGFLIVNRAKIGGSCTSDEDCITEKATCQRGTCLCPKNDVLLRLTESGYEVCRKLSYRLYDPCEFSEECFHLVDSKSVCAKNHICVCAAWAVDMNGKCVSKSEMNYNKNQELYRVGLVAITCLIIIIVAISLWITLRKSCLQRSSDSQRSTMPGDQSQGTITSLSDDKPPSYDDALEATDTVSSPPNFKDALVNSMTAKRLLRQVSAPAGQLLSRTTSLDLTKKINSSAQSYKQKS